MPDDLQADIALLAEARNLRDRLFRTGLDRERELARVLSDMTHYGICDDACRVALHSMCKHAAEVLEPDDLQARIAAALARIETCPEHTRTALLTRDGERYCPSCELRERLLATAAEECDNRARPSGVGSTGPAAEHDACLGGGDA